MLIVKRKGFFYWQMERWRFKENQTMLIGCFIRLKEPKGNIGHWRV